MLKIADEYGSGQALLCELHFRKLKAHITAAQNQGVDVTFHSVKTRGCRFCKADKVGFSRWSGSMFPIWRGFKQNESR